jgi:nucleoside-diphosphate-sugar epimerase
MVPLGAADARAAADAFRGRAGRLVAVSSGDVYAAYGHAIGREPRPQPSSVPDDTGLLDEDAPLRATLYPYGRVTPSPWDGELRDYEKLLVERVVLATPDLPGTVLRLPAVYGPGDGQRRFAAWLRRMDDGRPRLLLGARQARWRWTHGFVDDVAAAIALAATDARAAARVYNVGEVHTPTLAERLRALARAAGWDGELVTVADGALPASLREPVDHTVHLALDTTRIRRELGYAEQVAPDEALARTVAWERAAPAPRERLRLDYAAEDAALAASRSSTSATAWDKKRSPGERR